MLGPEPTCEEKMRVPPWGLDFTSSETLKTGFLNVEANLLEGVTGLVWFISGVCPLDGSSC